MQAQDFATEEKITKYAYTDDKEAVRFSRKESSVVVFLKESIHSQAEH